MFSFLEKFPADALIVPHRDRFLHPTDRLERVCGFTGSRGTLVLGRAGSALAVDSRYTLQAKTEVASEISVLLDDALEEWMRTTYGPETVFGHDPWCHSVSSAAAFKRWSETWSFKTVDFSSSESLTYGPIQEHPAVWAGISAQQKTQDLFESLRKDGVDGLFLDAEDLCWVLNIRGADIPEARLFRGYGWATPERLFVFSDASVPGTLEALERRPVHDFEPFLQEQAKNAVSVRWSPSKTPLALHALFPNASDKTNPVALTKSCKNTAELAGMERAHLFEGIVWANVLHGLSQQNPSERTEWDVSEAFERFRGQNAEYICPSFQSIVGFGKNGAMVHYHPTDRASAFLGEGALLIDAGGQYVCGTTDATRTLWLGGKAPETFRAHYTAVLQGHINLATAVFPEKTRGVHLDALARAPLWALELDYAHSTGHGVGASLCVHEAPPSVGQHDDRQELRPGMVLSNEPGLYLEDAYGIRLENLMRVEEPSSGWRRFALLTCIPFETALVDFQTLTPSAQTWFCAYQRRVVETLAPHLAPDVAAWLETYTL